MDHLFCLLTYELYLYNIHQLPYPFLPFQSRTDRIVFKLFGKEPNDFPLVLRAQVLNLIFVLCCCLMFFYLQIMSM
jgi:hypothetical protein